MSNSYMEAGVDRFVRRDWIVLIMLFVIAAFFRLYQIESLPPGLFVDEAVEGNDAVRTLETGQFRVFYPSNNGREGLFVWTVAASLSAFGNHPWAIRVVSASFGILTVCLLYVLGRALLGWRIAAIGSFLLATSFWHVNFSRIGFRPITSPVFVIIGLYFLYRAWSSLQPSDWLLAGIFWGLGFYTYIAFRIIPVVGALLVTCLWWRSRQSNAVFPLRGVVSCVIAMAAVLAPLAYYFVNHPEDLFLRSAAVSVVSADVPRSVVIGNVAKTFGMFLLGGDQNWRHNYRGDTTLPFIVMLFFVAGLVRCIFLVSRSGIGREAERAVLLSWFIVGIVPAALSDAAPHALRALIVAPAVYLVAADGIWWLLSVVNRRFSIGWSRAFASAVLALLIVAGWNEYDKYFHRWAVDPSVKGAFMQNLVDLGNHLNDLPLSVPKYVYLNADFEVNIDGLPGMASPIMFVTNTFQTDNQVRKNIHYVSGGLEQFSHLPPGSQVFPVAPLRVPDVPNHASRK